MARQRFIWPQIWSDPEFGRLNDTERVLFIGLFSNADDEGRILADPSYLRSTIWPFAENLTGKKVRAIRDSVRDKCPSVHLYQHKDIEYIALLKWDQYQRPKYPKPSTIPAPDSPNIPPSLEEASANASPQGWVGLGRDGLGRDGKGTSLTNQPTEANYEPVGSVFTIDPDQILRAVDA